MGLGASSLSSCNSSNIPLFKISLAEWSLNKGMRSGEIPHLDFAKIAKRNFGIDAIEYVNQLFADKSGGSGEYINEMKSKVRLKQCKKGGQTGGRPTRLSSRNSDPFTNHHFLRI